MCIFSPNLKILDISGRCAIIYPTNFLSIELLGEYLFHCEKQQNRYIHTPFYFHLLIIASITYLCYLLEK